MNIHERMRRQFAKQEKARNAADYKAGESTRRSDAARLSNAYRRDVRIEALCNGDAIPRNEREQAIQDRAEQA